MRIAYSETLLASKLGDESLPMADDTDATRWLLLMDSLSLSLSLFPPRPLITLVSCLGPLGPIQPPIGGKKWDRVKRSLSHTQNSTMANPFAILEEEGRGKTKAEARNGIDEIQS